MAKEADHIRLANQNHSLLLHLLEHGMYPDWAATVAFYKAVHIAEAVFAHDLRRHSTSHTDRESWLKVAKYREIFKNYSHLLTASRIARYLECAGGIYSVFTDYLDLAGVKKMLGKRLRGVEQAALRFLSDSAQGALLKIDHTREPFLTIEV